MRRRLLALLATVVLAACRQREARPVHDVILITIDTLRADAPGFTGNARVKTPFLDALAARGTVFTHAHAHNVVTLPSHTNILTGLYPWQHGIRDNAGFALDAKQVTLASLLHDAGFATGAFVSAYPLDSRFGLARGFDTYDDQYGEAAHVLDFAVQERPGNVTLARAKEWWQAHGNQRRFLWVHLYEPHAPYIPPQPFRDEYRDRLYLGEVAAADAMLAATLGPLLDAAPDTLVVVTGDHGESLGEHGEQTHGLFAYESTLAVPLVVADPTRKHAIDDRWVGHIDIAPTILARAGIAPPAAMKGRSLFAAGERPHTYFEALSASLNRGWAPLVGVISGGKKLIELPLPELYDLPRDPHEAANRYGEDRRSVVALRELLKSEAPTPAKRSNVTSEEQSKLLSLGYLSGTSAKTTYTVDDDPKRLVTLDNELHEAIAAYQMGKLDRALELSRKLVAARPDMQLAQEMLAFFLAQNENPDEAIAVLERKVAAGTANEAMRTRLGLLLSENGRARAAVAVLQPLANGSDLDVINAYGIALADSGDVNGAVAAFQRVLNLDRDNAKAYQNLGIVALRNGQRDLARRYLDHALSINANLPLALNVLGVIDAQSGNRAMAIERWSRAVAIDPSQLDALFNLGLVAAAEGKREVARKALRDYIARAPKEKFAAERKRAEDVLRSL
ncbi:MAG TPA: sulfatase-like hydrolase/transferase [Thermoanaerobaculia bacterium]|nr:sulfatase-like hydrolase/transferase [Thermoanaerobaculia bacterium]